MKKVTEDLVWKNIDHEEYRVYVFQHVNGTTTRVKIKEPKLLNVSKSGGHRILDSKNVAHYIPYGWIHLYWETIDGVAFRF